MYISLCLSLCRACDLNSVCVKSVCVLDECVCVCVCVYVLRVYMCLLCEGMFMQISWICVHMCVCMFKIWVRRSVNVPSLVCPVE